MFVPALPRGRACLRYFFVRFADEEMSANQTGNCGNWRELGSE